MGLIFRLMPVLLDLGDQVVLGLLGALLGLVALVLEIGLKLIHVPTGVRGRNFVAPVLFDDLLKILPLGGAGIGDVMVIEPTLKFGLVPAVVS